MTTSRINFDHGTGEQPERHLEAFARAGGDILNVHVEACPHLHRVLQQIKALGRRAGVCLNSATPLSAVEEVLEDADQVIVMGVNHGWGGKRLSRARYSRCDAWARCWTSAALRQKSRSTAG